MFGLFKKKDYVDRLDDITLYNFKKFTEEEQLDAAALDYIQFAIEYADRERDLKRDSKLSDERLNSFNEAIDDYASGRDTRVDTLSYIQNPFVDYHICKERINDLGHLTFLRAYVPMAIYDSFYNLDSLEGPNIVKLLKSIYERGLKPDFVEYFNTRYGTTSFRLPDDWDDRDKYVDGYEVHYSEFLTMHNLCQIWAISKRMNERMKEEDAGTYKPENYYNENDALIDDHGYVIGTDFLTKHYMYNNTTIDFKGLDKLPFTPQTQALIDGDLGKYMKILDKGLLADMRAHLSK